MRAHYLQHVPFEGLGSIGTWLSDAGANVTGTRLFRAEAVPGVDDLDCLIVMGGPMSVHDERRFPWLAREKAFIRRVMDAGKPVLGVCLGAQLIASALGATVSATSSREIGWFPVSGVDVPAGSAFSFPRSALAFHWHGETFDLPAGAVLLAESAACRNQAFQIGSTVIGLQFHLEATPESVQSLVAACRDELLPSRYVQTAEEILSVDEARYEEINGIMDDVLSYLL